MNGRRPTFIIAEAGVNHNGSLDIALELVAAAKACGADAVKFQTFSADRLVTRSASKAAYQKTTVPNGDSQYEMLKQLELGPDAFEQIRACCEKHGIEFMSSPFDEEAADMLDALGMRVFKIPSGEITNLPLLRHIAAKQREIILSTGMCWIGEVETAVRTLRDAGARQVTLLHCVTEYPAPFDQINLAAMHTLATAFGLPVGYSDHTAGIEIPIAAVALGATVIEKHFTLDTNMSGPDHRASLDPTDFKRMVDAIRNVEKAIGDGHKRPAACELANIEIVRKSVVAARDIPAGKTIARDDVLIKRPGTGIPPAELDSVVGRVARQNIAVDSVIRWQDLG
jgi:N,N'-diacetyllegionaminate synthase